MAKAKLYKLDELRKMGVPDRLRVLKDTLKQIAHDRIQLKGGENKDSASYQKYKTQAAHINTLNNEPQHAK